MMKKTVHTMQMGSSIKRFKAMLGYSILVLLSVSLMGARKFGKIEGAAITASAHSPSIPVLKGLSANPVVRVMVSIPAGNEAQQYSSIRCTLNDPREVQQVDVYLTGAEPFATNRPIGSIQPSSGLFEIPVTLQLQPGLHFVWLSIVLKNDASVNNRITLHCSSLHGTKGGAVMVKEDRSGFTKRTGVAFRKAGEDGVNTYRIPGVIQTDRGTLIAVYDVRYTNSGDLPGNIDVGMSRSTDSGRTWQAMKVIMDMGAPHENNGIGDPAVLFDPKTKKIWVAALWSKGNRSIAGSLPGLAADTTGQFVLVNSSDDGISWSAPASVTPQVKNPSWQLFFDGPGSGIAMQDGRLVFAAQYWNETKIPYSTIIYSSDHGSTWKGKLNGPKSNTTESQVVETTPGTLMLNMRDNRGNFRSVATTANMGGSWIEHATSYNALPDPVCMASIIKARVKVQGVIKEVLFFSNPATHSGRYNMTIKASLDMGETWLPANQLLLDERSCYGYSSLTRIDDHTIGLVYEGIKDLYFVSVPVSEIIQKLQ